MASIRISSIRKYVEENIGSFHNKRLLGLERLRLSKILQRKNPYLFRAKNILTAQDLVKTLLDAHLSSQEEAVFGDFLEDLAVYINKRVYKGRKSSTEGIDLEFDRDGIRYVVAIKSGPNWANSSQIRKMKEDFAKARRILRTGRSRLQVVAVNGCCYGHDDRPDKGDYYKYCGQSFWEFISGNEELYLKIVKPLGHRAKEKNEKFMTEYSALINRFTHEFVHNFCVNGVIDWGALVRYNSSKEKPRKRLFRPPAAVQATPPACSDF